MRHAGVVTLLASLLIGAPLAVGGPAGAAPATTPAAPPGAAPGAPVTVAVASGTITSVSPDGLVLGTPGGSVQVRTTAQTRVAKRVRARLEDVKVGDFVGAAARREANGSLTALYVNVFEGALRGQVRSGQSPMAGGDVMTNVVVTEYVAGVSGRTMTLTLPGQSPVQINVPAEAQINRVYVTTRGDVQANRAATVRGTRNSDGSIMASSITLEPR